MSESILSTISEIKAKIAAKESEILPLKITVNELCKIAGIPEEFASVSVPGGAGAPLTRPGLNWRPDHFFNRPLATCVVEYFEARKKAAMDGPASIDEIYEALVKGGFKFEGTSGSEANTKRAIKISLTKNTAQFAKVNDDLFGLKKWYNMRSSRRPASRLSGSDEPEIEDASTPSGDEAANEMNSES